MATYHDGSALEGGSPVALQGRPLRPLAAETGVRPPPSAAPTQPPIIVEPPQVSVEPAKTVSARINSSLGEVNATVADPTIATAVVDQAQRVLYVTGVKVGTTTVTVTDSRGVTRAVGVLVAYAAGSVADQIGLRVKQSHKPYRTRRCGGRAQR